jgi:hypothetical protein
MPIGKRKRRKRSVVKKTNKKQSARFVAAAKELGLGESGEEFERAMGALVKPKQGKP